MKQLTLNQQLDKLFKEWNKKSIENGDSVFFVKDGIPYKPNAKEEGYECEIWNKIDKKVLFLLKDQNQGKDKNKFWNDDTRVWFRDENIKGHKSELFTKKHFKVLTYCLYGILNPTMEFQDINYIDAINNFDIQPFAYVECKKQPGTKTCPSNLINSYLYKYKNYLEAEINILKPNIIVCSCQEIFDFVNNEILKESIKKQSFKNDFDSHKRDTIIFHQEFNKLVVLIPHPSTPGLGYEYYYNFLMTPYKTAIKSLKIVEKLNID
jgi:hypothetical protein